MDAKAISRFFIIGLFFLFVGNACFAEKSENIANEKRDLKTLNKKDKKATNHTLLKK